MKALLLFLSWPIFSFAQTIPGTAWKLNPAHKFTETSAHNYMNKNGIEIAVRPSRFQSESAALSMSRIEFTNIENLYGARRNPYQGQVSDVVKCDEVLKPRAFFFKLHDRDVRALLVGANPRRALGVCVKDQLAYWVAYFNFYDAPSKSVWEFRIFTKVSSVAELYKASAQLESLAKSLLVPTK